MAQAGLSIIPQSADRQSFRAAMSRFATGVAVLTAVHEGQRFGMTVNSLTSVSLEPCQLLVCVSHGSATGRAIKASGVFALSLLERQQMDVARSFVGRDAGRFEAIACATSADGPPLVEGALATLSCRVADVLTSGDHEILIGDVVECWQRPGEPLVFFGGSYGGFNK